MIREKEKENLLGQMVESTLVSGKEENSMAKEFILAKKVSKGQENGIMGKR